MKENKLDIDQIILEKAIAKNIRKSGLAKGCGIAPSSLDYKLKHRAFSVSDLERIAELMDCDLQIALVPKKG